MGYTQQFILHALFNVKRFPMDFLSDSPILVTGASGYIAGHVVKQLLEHGNTVHAAVRNPQNTEKLSALENAANSSSGKIRFFAADLNHPGSYTQAMQGCKIIIHTASPFLMSSKNPQKDLVEPAVSGTRNVLKSVESVPSVKRVVVTSSCAAIYGDNQDCARASDNILDESYWNTSSSLTHKPLSILQGSGGKGRLGFGQIPESLAAGYGQPFAGHGPRP